MEVSLCNEVLRELSFADQCALAAGLGYDGLELAPFTLAEKPHLLPAGRRAELRRVAEDAGVPITGLHWLLLTPDGLSITSPDEAVRTRTLDVMRRLIELCADLGGTILVHGSPKQRQIADGEARATAVARATKCFAAIAGDAEAAGVTYCIEALAPPEATIITTVEEAASIVRKVGSAAVQTMIDCAASRGEQVSVPELIERFLPTGLIRHIHLNDPNLRGPGQGKLPFGPILAALRRHHYQGRCSLEPFVYEPDGPTSAARGIGYVRGLLEVIEKVD
jgi:D-psicose/D-tagatose/L-ribulose 3-epimerase